MLGGSWGNLSTAMIARQACHPEPRASLVAQRLHWIEPRGAIGRKEGEDTANQESPDANDCDIAGNHFGRKFGKLINLLRERVDVSGAGQPAAKFIAVP